MHAFWTKIYQGLNYFFHPNKSFQPNIGFFNFKWNEIFHYIRRKWWTRKDRNILFFSTKLTGNIKIIEKNVRFKIDNRSADTQQLDRLSRVPHDQQPTQKADFRRNSCGQYRKQLFGGGHLKVPGHNPRHLHEVPRVPAAGKTHRRRDKGPH